MNSALYVGRVRHRRFAPARREFDYPLYMSYLDLDELGGLDRAAWPLLGVRFPAFARFHPRDHLGGAPLADAVRDAVVAAGLPRPTGAIALLTHARHLGFAMNPVSFFYCWNPAGSALDAIVAEVSNTPWDQRHLYVVPRTRHRFAKAFHVSPFLPMGLAYDWRFTTPGSRLAVHMTVSDAERVMLDATLVMARRPLDRRHLAPLLARFPLMTAQVLGQIYGQAARLWWRRTPFFAHPSGARS